MALSTLPYHGKITVRALAGAQWALTVVVTDNGGATRGTKVIHLSATATLSEMEDAIHDQIGAVLVSDAGSAGALVDAMITGATLFNF